MHKTVISKENNENSKKYESYQEKKAFFFNLFEINDIDIYKNKK